MDEVSPPQKHGTGCQVLQVQKRWIHTHTLLSGLPVVCHAEECFCASAGIRRQLLCKPVLNWGYSPVLWGSAVLTNILCLGRRYMIVSTVVVHWEIVLFLMC